MKNIEIDILKSFRNISNQTTDTLFRIISFLGEQYLLIVVLLAIYYLCEKKVGQRIVYAVITTLCLNNTIKGLVKYPRPFVYDETLKPAESAISSATGYSFPSGHTQNTTTVFSAIAFSFKKKKVTIFCIIIIALVGLSRLFLGVHYPKDVLFGLLFGLFSTFLSFYLFKLCNNDNTKIHLVYLITLVVFFPFVFIFWTNNYNELILLRDFYITYSLSIGLILGMILEEKFVGFEKSNLLKTNLLRLLGGAISTLIAYGGLKLLFSINLFPQEGNSYKIIFDSIRYFFVGITPVGIFPILFKNILFKKELN